VNNKAQNGNISSPAIFFLEDDIGFSCSFMMIIQKGWKGDKIKRIKRETRC